MEKSIHLGTIKERIRGRKDVFSIFLSQKGQGNLVVKHIHPCGGGE